MKNSMFIILSLLIFYSCRSTRSVQKHDTNTDSVRVIKKDSGLVKKESVTTNQGKKQEEKKIEKKDREITTVIEDYKIPDSAKSGVTRRTTVIDKDHGVIVSKKTITDSLQRKSEKTDSAFSNATDSSHLKKHEKGKTSEVERWPSYWFYVWAIGLIVLIYFIWKYRLKIKTLFMKLLPL